MNYAPIARIVVVKSGDHPVNPRTHFDTVGLQQSMRLIGQDVPIKVFSGPALDVPEGYYGLIDGQRRLTAAKALSWKEIRIEVLPAPDTLADLLALMLASDVTEPFRPSELGRALAQLARDHLWGIEKVAAVRGLKASEAQLLVDLAFAPPEVQQRVDSGEMSLSAWKVLRDKPESVKIAAASLEKPTKAAVRRLTQEKPGIGVFDAIQATAASEPELLIALNDVRLKLLAGWHKLTPGEQAKARARLDAMLAFIGEGYNETVLEEG